MVAYVEAILSESRVEQLNSAANSQRYWRIIQSVKCMVWCFIPGQPQKVTCDIRDWKNNGNVCMMICKIRHSNVQNFVWYVKPKHYLTILGLGHDWKTICSEMDEQGI